MENAIIIEKPTIKFSDVAGLDAAKQALYEAIIMPIKVPHLFKKGTKPWRGILLYGPPGTGKSYLAKAVAGEASESTFLSVSTAELTSKWVGESEKLIRDLFETARRNKPSIIFIDEIDSLVGARGEGSESESGRRIKTEFLIQLDGVGADNEGVVFVAATNTPWDVDAAMRRRFEKRVYIPLPDEDARLALIRGRLNGEYVSLSESGMAKLARATGGYSGADLSILIRDALMAPIRELQRAAAFKRGRALGPDGRERTDLWVACEPGEEGAVRKKWTDLDPAEIGKPIVSGHYFRDALKKVRPSVSKKDLKRYEEWTSEYGEEGV